jgi:hypothetical protein
VQVLALADGAFVRTIGNNTVNNTVMAHPSAVAFDSHANVLIVAEHDKVVGVVGGRRRALPPTGNPDIFVLGAFWLRLCSGCVLGAFRCILNANAKCVLRAFGCICPVLRSRCIQMRSGCNGASCLETHFLWI